MIRSEADTHLLVARPGLVLRLLHGLSAALLRQRARQSLAYLDTHLLRDIGLTADEARDEVSKPFWQT